jgi:RNA polymerase sigma factor (sigma-70 family)
MKKAASLPSPPAGPDGKAGMEGLVEKRALFRAFLRKRLASDAEVDDLLQHTLIKAMRQRDSVRDNEKLVAWFYRLLRRALIDHHRSESSRKMREETWLRERSPDASSRAAICGCLEGVIARLEPRAAELVRRVDLQGEPVARVASSLGMTANAAMVALHRARARLRRELVAFCGDCAEGACLDCDCGEKAM